MCVCKCIQIPQLATLLLVSSEMAIDVRIRIGGHPDKLLDLVTSFFVSYSCTYISYFCRFLKGEALKIVYKGVTGFSVL